MQSSFMSMGPSNYAEDCLYLNVWTPAKSASEKLPVMVWIYGGGFTAGQTSIPAYDGTSLARKGVIMVSIAYRLGALGFLAHPELSSESGKGSGAYGLADEIAGLRWVKDNIAKFGGDPRNVTVFGESAGGMSVSMLAASPPARGLFAKAISESGGSFGPLKTANEGGSTVPSLKAAEATGQQVFAALGVADLKAARALPADRVTKAQGQFWPVADGEFIVGDQYELYEQGRFNDTPVLIGTNADEIGYVFGSGPMGVAPGAPPPPRTADDDVLIGQFQGYWTNFAKNGDPNGPGLPTWPVYTRADPRVMNIAPTEPLAGPPNMRQLKALDDYFAWRRAQAR